MKRGVRAFLSLSVTLLLLYLFLRGVDLPAAWKETRQARPPWLLVCLAGSFLHYGLRAARWRALLSAASRRCVPYRLVLACTLIGYFLSAVLPGRPGELVRPVLLAVRAGLSRSTALATILLERAVLDPLALLALLVPALLLGGAGAHPSPASEGLRRSVLAAGGALAAAFVLAVAAGGWIVSHRRRWIPWLRGALAGGERRARLLDGLERFADGLTALRARRVWPAAVVGSLLLWASVALGLWGGMRAFRADVGYLDAVVLSTLAAAGVAVPTPGGVGGFHLAVQFGLTTLYGVPLERSVPAALFTHLLLLLPALTAGAWLTWRQGLHLSALWRGSGEWAPRAGGAPAP